MALIKKYNPVLNGLFDDLEKAFSYGLTPSINQNTVPAVNIAENENAFKIEVAAPGFNKQEFTIKLEGSFLTVSAQKESEKENGNSKLLNREFAYSGFKRSFTLPRTVDTEKIEASYNNGILEINLQKKEEAKKKEPKQISIA